MYSIRQFSAFHSHFQVTSGQITLLPGHLRSPGLRDVISCHLTASSCELQPCRKWSVQYTAVCGLLQSIPGDFRSNNVILGSLPVTWGHVTSIPVTWLPPPLSYTLVGSEMYSIRDLSALSSLFQVPSGQMTPLPRHFLTPEVVTSLPVTWLPPPASNSLVGSEIYGIRQFLHLSTTSKWLPVKWRHFRVTSGHLK